MSVKFQKEVIRDTVVDGAVNGVKGGKKEDLAHVVGNVLTGGKSNTGYMAVCLSTLPSDETLALLLCDF
jgi:hypothetical protein